MSLNETILNGDALWRNISEPEWRAVMASTNALVDARNETDLLKDICDAAVNAGGYLLAWYARALQDGSYGFEILAVTGPAKGYVDGIIVTWDDEITGQGPAGQAVRSGRPVVVSDRADPLYAPWAGRAEKYGIKSTVAIPVYVKGNVDGFLAIYSDAEDSFDSVGLSVLETFCQKVGVGIERLQSNVMVNEALEGTIRVLAAALEARDPYTAGHQSAVADLAGLIGTKLELSDFDLQGIRLAAIVHDIGKIGVPTELLVKPSTLREVEIQLLHEHARIGEEILSKVNFPWPIAQIVGQHHERLDGSGYPKGLRGDAIMLYTRIIVVADIVEAMGRTRPYRTGLGIDVVLAELAKGRGVVYDADVVDACLQVLDEGLFKL